MKKGPTCAQALINIFFWLRFSTNRFCTFVVLKLNVSGLRLYRYSSGCASKYYTCLPYTLTSKLTEAIKVIVPEKTENNSEVGNYKQNFELKSVILPFQGFLKLWKKKGENIENYICFTDFIVWGALWRSFAIKRVLYEPKIRGKKWRRCSRIFKIGASHWSNYRFDWKFFISRAWIEQWAAESQCKFSSFLFSDSQNVYIFQFWHPLGFSVTLSFLRTPPANLKRN